MKKITAGIIALVLCTTLIVTGLKTSADVSGADDTFEVNTADPRTDGTEQLGEATDLISSFISSIGSENENTGRTNKDETVYVIADAAGEVQKVIVSDWLKNENKDTTIDDKSTLKDIVNVKGDETYSRNGDVYCWNASGEDISYQGTSDKELPIKVKITFILDGKEMSPEEIKGKSGHVKMIFDYENNEKVEVEIGGKKEEMTVPFVMLTGVILDDERFTNITAKTAKLLNDGSRTVIVGIALPGIQENLGLDDTKFKIPDHLEIEADVNDFSIGMTVTAATAELFGKLDSIDAGSLDSISDSMAQLTSAMDQLVNGSEALSTGLELLLEKSGELGEGVEQLADGSAKLKDGIKAADDGAGQLADGAGSLSDGAGQLKGGIDQLSTGLDQLKANNDALMNGALQVFNTLLKTAENSLKEAGAEIDELTADNYAEVLDGIAKKLSAAAGLMEKADPETAAVYAAKAESVTALKGSLDSYNMFYQGLGAYTEGVAQAAVGAGTLDAGAEALQTGADALKKGLNDLKDGTGKLYDGADALNTGLNTLNAGIPELKEGVSQLSSGARLLADGIKEFNEQGISKITEAVEGELEGIIERIRVMGIVARNYNNFSGISDGMSGQVKFIYRTEEIK